MNLKKEIYRCCFTVKMPFKNVNAIFTSLFKTIITEFFGLICEKPLQYEINT